MSLLEQIKQNGVFLLALLPKRGQYHLSKCLAQGFDEKNIPFNTNFADPSFDFARNENITTDNAAICVFDISAIDGETIKLEETHEKLRALPGKHKVFLSMSDSNSDFYIEDENAILLATSETAFIERPGNRIPWAFGFSKELLKEAETRNYFAHSENKIVRNFRPSLSQHVRQALDLILLPKLESHFEIDKKRDDNPGRFKPKYYDQLSSAMGCLTYGGTFSDDITKNVFLKNNPFFMKPEGGAIFPNKFKYNQETVIVRWDSWRFWETMVMGCLNICIDLEKYGCMLPQMPNNWEHYIGLDLDNLQRDVDRMIDEKDKLPEIAKAGQVWANAFYSPKAVAQRFTETLAKEIDGQYILRE